MNGKNMVIKKTNLPDTVVWNPWLEKAKTMSDFADDEYHNMICVEAGNVKTPIVLSPGAEYEASQILCVLDKILDSHI
ncbi:uncharacterized protein LOC102804275 [Saccoglossus kowalevskii]|uniref:Galactose mutarotase n=1 Tax=Saccoglossus kowalevskii TaxID=10224 RepID=A0ABM0M1U7_SACKO|nr:PREDICTED: putative glucose-6-phosphate 1-epimerase-like [Saccoglossus kowalevskii]